MEVYLNCEIFIVSCAKHFPWLEYCLKSIEKYATGFSDVTIVIPESDLGKGLPIGRFFRAEREWDGKGFLWHMAQVMRADEWCPEADFILHIDSDCVFSEPVTPDDYIIDGKPVLYHERFASIGKKHPDVLRWQQVVQSCVTFKVTQETMRRHPAVHRRENYGQSRFEIRAKTKMPWDEYIKSCRNEFPQGFCEYVTLGNVAMRYFPTEYHFVDMEHTAWPKQKIVQFSSGNSPANVVFDPKVPQRPVVNGQPFECTPEYFLK